MRQTTKLLAPTVAVAALLAACGGSSKSPTSSTAASSQPAQTNSATAAAVVKTASNAKLGARILVDTRGMTLYRLSAEHDGKFICTGAACLQVWRPLAAPSASALARGVGHLSTVKRPDGTAQVAYNGMPLYTFARDRAPGDANGQGLKDVGTWNAVSASAPTTTPAPASAPAKPSSGGY
jgi:predicted lipoprotein with Yx(FWY)xxD motif